MWDGLTGNLSRVYRGLAESDLTAVCLDARQRKLFVGDQQGKIRVYNYVTGAYMKSMSPHNEEIISMCYSGSRRLLISATDRTVLVHDERSTQQTYISQNKTTADASVDQRSVAFPLMFHHLSLFSVSILRPVRSKRPCST